MIPMKTRIRDFSERDIPRLVEILELNEQYDCPEVEGPTAMERAANCDAAVFLVAEVEGQPCGFIRGVYDGSRAVIHLLSVHPDHQRLGIGKALVDATIGEFLNRDAPTVSATVTEESIEFWKRQGFRRLPVFLVLKDID